MTTDSNQTMTPSESGSEMPIDTGLQSLLLMASLHGVAADAAQLQHQYGSESFSTQTILGSK